MILQLILFLPRGTIHRFLQLWCFGQFSQEILPLSSGKAAADLALIHQPALVLFTKLGNPNPPQAEQLSGR
jgi:hypothetical protein